MEYACCFSAEARPENSYRRLVPFLHSSSFSRRGGEGTTGTGECSPCRPLPRLRVHRRRLALDGSVRPGGPSSDSDNLSSSNNSSNGDSTEIALTVESVDVRLLSEVDDASVAAATATRQNLMLTALGLRVGRPAGDVSRSRPTITPAAGAARGGPSSPSSLGLMRLLFGKVYLRHSSRRRARPPAAGAGREAGLLRAAVQPLVPRPPQCLLTHYLMIKRRNAKPFIKFLQANSSKRSKDIHRLTTNARQMKKVPPRKARLPKLENKYLFLN